MTTPTKKEVEQVKSHPAFSSFVDLAERNGVYPDIDDPVDWYYAWVYFIGGVEWQKESSA